MRFAATLISAQMLAAVASAETPFDKIVSVFNEVCVAPASSEGRMVAGETNAAKENWKLIRSEPAPMPFMHNENGPKNSFVSGWQFDVPGGSQASLYVSILRPEQPGVRYDICLVQPATDFDVDDLTLAIDRQFGPTLAKDTSGRFKSQESWFFAEERAKGNCGKQVFFSLNQSSNRGKPKTLVFTDFAYPNDSQWDAMAKSTRCPNR